SYTYFTWRNTKQELTEYVTELAGDAASYMRPNFFVNTPDILPGYLQEGGRPAFEARAVLAATLAPSWGVYA
ncbi:alpha-1,4-glucan--maltose-1-phosphate maltosyltransferase, partial [Streptomyces sp. SID7982]|nr:alpha-1,4-glucan--maltose-1-phosphate maltosyltransferase [Streptomyces sp. SID7982]